MAKTKRSHQRWRLVGGGIVLALAAALLLLSLVGAGKVALGVGLALFFLAWPLMFLALGPPAKPGLDPVTAKYYHPKRTQDRAATERPDAP